MKLISVAEKKSLLKEFPKFVPTASNYCDLMLNETIDTLNNYLIFYISKSDEHCIGGLSESGPAFNIYSTSKTLALEMYLQMKTNIGNKTPKYLRGNVSVLSAVTGQLHSDGAEIIRQKIYHPMTKLIHASNPQVLELKRATSSDVKFVANWINEYNKELKESFSIPTPDEITKKEIYIASIDNIKIGGYFRTIKSKERYWLARFYVAPSFRNKGYATTLLNTVETTQASKHDEIHLHVVNSNHQALKFYQHYGFIKIEDGFNVTLG